MLLLIVLSLPLVIVNCSYPALVPSCLKDTDLISLCHNFNFFSRKFCVIVQCVAAQLFYMGIVIFVPATAMETMVDFPFWGSVIITGTVATIYTTLVSDQTTLILAVSIYQLLIEYLRANSICKFLLFAMISLLSLLHICL